MMTDASTDNVEKILLYWYDREETDEEIVAELHDNLGDDDLRIALQDFRIFLGSALPAEQKEKVIRGAAWRYFPPGSAHPLAWLRHLVDLMERELAERE